MYTLTRSDIVYSYIYWYIRSVWNWTNVAIPVWLYSTRLQLKSIIFRRELCLHNKAGFYHPLIGSKYVLDWMMSVRCRLSLSLSLSLKGMLSARKAPPWPYCGSCLLLGSRSILATAGSWLLMCYCVRVTSCQLRFSNILSMHLNTNSLSAIRVLL